MRTLKVWRLLALLLLAALVVPPASGLRDAAWAQGVAPSPTVRPAAATPSAGMRARPVQVRTTVQQPAPDGRPMAPGRLIVRFTRGASPPAREAAHRAAAAAATAPLPLPDTVLVDVSPRAVGPALAA